MHKINKNICPYKLDTNVHGSIIHNSQKEHGWKHAKWMEVRHKKPVLWQEEDWYLLWFWESKGRLGSEYVQEGSPTPFHCCVCVCVCVWMPSGCLRIQLNSDIAYLEMESDSTCKGLSPTRPIFYFRKVSVVSDTVSPCTVTHQAPLSIGFSRQEYLSARILECIAIHFSRRSSQPRDWTWVFCIAGGFFTDWATREAPFHFRDELKVQVVTCTSDWLAVTQRAP